MSLSPPCSSITIPLNQKSYESVIERQRGRIHTHDRSEKGKGRWSPAARNRQQCAVGCGRRDGAETRGSRGNHRRKRPGRPPPRDGRRPPPPSRLRARRGKERENEAGFGGIYQGQRACDRSARATALVQIGRQLFF